MSHFTYLDPVFGKVVQEKNFDTTYENIGKIVENYGRITTAILLGITLIVIGIILKNRIKNEEKIQKEIIPDGKFSLFSIFDFFVEKFTAFYDSVLGENHREHLPFIASIFIFIFLGNVLGLVPGMPAITAGVPVTLGMAIVAFLYFNIQGVKAHGAWGYFKHFCGPVIFLCWLMLPLELFSTTLRILTLNLRLFWNITADHEMLTNVTDHVCRYFVPAILYALGLFVSFMQAFVFTVLNMVYIKLAIEEEGEGEEKVA